ncbi:aryl sulfotransferase, partial [Burkholderia cenocepacia]|nr:aryl sulfotransferase [Burkholderia cenocepacia]MDI9690412.1 aryl sulfotransferase [Burkholderia cenocepacia]
MAHDPALSAGGYTLIAPQTADGNVYLVGIDGEVVHQW